MAAQTKYPTQTESVVGESAGTVSWSNHGNVKVEDDTRATVVLTAIDPTSYELHAYGFGFDLEKGCTVTGVTITVERLAGLPANVEDGQVRIVSGGAVVGNVGDQGAWPTSETKQAYGGTSDLWGLSLTPAYVDDPAFGCSVYCVVAAADTASVDVMYMTVHYTGSGRFEDGMRPRLRVGDGMWCGG